jgi:hypothetical protein
MFAYSGFADTGKTKIPDEVMKLVKERESARVHVHRPLAVNLI